MTDLRSASRHLASAFFFFFCLTFISTGALKVYMSPANSDYLYIALLAHIKHFTCNHLNWLDQALLFLFCFVFLMKFVYSACVRLDFRSDLNTWLPEKIALCNFALNYIFRSRKQRGKAVFSRSYVRLLAFEGFF